VTKISNEFAPQAIFLETGSRTAWSVLFSVRAPLKMLIKRLHLLPGLHKGEPAGAVYYQGGSGSR
jgi:hypothetical protein